MGLDMYLSGNVSFYPRKFNTGGDYEVSRDFYAIADVAGLNEYLPETDDFIGGIKVNFPLGYWRKANAIHNWFVTKCANGIDECQQIHLPAEKLYELREDCQACLDNPSRARNILPPVAGFFFGSALLDEWYFNDLRHTIEIIDMALDAHKKELFDYFTYQASW